jgi:hypothetical protein
MNGYGGIFGGPMAGQLSRPPEQKPPRWLDGGKFKGKDALALALGAIGDAFTGRPMTANLVAGSFQQRRDAEQQQRMMQQQRQAGLEDYRVKKEIDLGYPEPVKPPAIAQEVEWFNRLTPEQKMQASQALDQLRPLMESTWQGPQVVPRGGGQPLAPVGRLTPIGEAAPQSAPQMVVSPMELNALVQRYGPDEVQRRIDSGVVAVRN